jgi:hypothetical protein
MRAFIKYRVTMSDGTKATIECDNAANAIGKALRLFPMRTVTECHSGYTESEAKLESQLRGEKVLVGYIPYEIPPHEPLPMKQEGASGPIHGQGQKNMTMFDESKVRSLSKAAKERFSHA